MSDWAWINDARSVCAPSDSFTAELWKPLTPYYSDDSCTIYHGRCEDVAVDADAIVTDPPYGIGWSKSERYCEIAAKRLGQEVLAFT